MPFEDFCLCRLHSSHSTFLFCKITKKNIFPFIAGLTQTCGPYLFRSIHVLLYNMWLLQGWKPAFHKTKALPLYTGDSHSTQPRECHTLFPYRFFCKKQIARTIIIDSHEYCIQNILYVYILQIDVTSSHVNAHFPLILCNTALWWTFVKTFLTRTSTQVPIYISTLAVHVNILHRTKCELIDHILKFQAERVLAFNTTEQLLSFSMARILKVYHKENRG